MTRNGTTSCRTSFDAPEVHFGYGITRAEIMDYLSQAYGPVSWQSWRLA
jgi:hypothetical protein